MRNPLLAIGTKLTLATAKELLQILQGNGVWTRGHEHCLDASAHAAKKPIHFDCRRLLYQTRWGLGIAGSRGSHDCPRVLHQVLFSRFSILYIIYTDQGANFKSHMFSELFLLLKNQTTRTTLYQSQCDTQVKKINRTLIELLAFNVTNCTANLDVNLCLGFIPIDQRCSLRQALHRISCFSIEKWNCYSTLWTVC